LASFPRRFEQRNQKETFIPLFLRVCVCYFWPPFKMFEKEMVFSRRGIFIDRQGFHQFGSYSREEAYRSSMSPKNFLPAI
jgi:hypothetical protein